MNKDMVIGTTRMWDDMVKEFPNSWIVIEQPTMDGEDIVSGVVVDILNDKEAITKLSTYIKDTRYVFERTNEGVVGGILKEISP